MKKYLIAIAGLILSLGSTAQAFNWRTIELNSGPIIIGTGEIRTLHVSVQQPIQKLYIQAEGASRSAGMFDVIVNGDTKGTVQVPNTDPTYVVTVGQVTSSIQFRSLSGGPVRIVRVLAVIPTVVNNSPGPIQLRDLNAITNVALRAIQISRQIESYATAVEMNTYVLPIRASAGQLYAVASGRGPYSSHVQTAAIEFLLRVDAAQPFIESLMQRNAAFETMVELLTLRAYLDDLIDRPRKSI